MTSTAISADNLPMALTREAWGFPDGWRAVGGDVAQWQGAARTILCDLALPDLPTPDADTAVLAEEDRGDHLARLLRLTLIEGVEAQALVLVPKGAGPFPAVLALHDHGSEFAMGKEKCIPAPGPANPQADAWYGRFFGVQPFGPELARRGHLVLCCDVLGWGALGGNGYEAQQALACNLMHLGLSAAGVLALQDQRALAVLTSLPKVDEERIATVGFSLGAFRAWQAAAMSPQVRAVVASGWMASLPELLVPGNNHLRGQSAFWMTHPLLHRHLDLPDVAALVAPRAMYVEVGQADHLFPSRAVSEAFAKLSEVWGAWGALDRLCLSRPAGGHAFLPAQQAAAFDWLERQLR